jgi:hypothetical protein
LTAGANAFRSLADLPAGTDFRLVFFVFFLRQYPRGYASAFFTLLAAKLFDIDTFFLRFLPFKVGADLFDHILRRRLAHMRHKAHIEPQGRLPTWRHGAGRPATGKLSARLVAGPA